MAWKTKKPTPDIPAVPWAEAAPAVAPKPPPEPACGVCRFFLHRGSEVLGQCRRYPSPQPHVQNTAWCGDFQPKESPNA